MAKSTCEAYTHPQWRKVAQLSVMWKIIQSEWKPESSHDGPHRKVTFEVQPMHVSHKQIQPFDHSRVDPQFR